MANERTNEWQTSQITELYQENVEKRKQSDSMDQQKQKNEFRMHPNSFCSKWNLRIWLCSRWLIRLRMN